MRDVEKIYERRIQKYNELLEEQKRNISRFSMLRLFIFLAAVMGLAYGYFYDGGILTLIVLIGLVLGFIYSAIIHKRMKDRKSYIEMYLKVNMDSLKRNNEEWKNLEDTGEEFEDQKHNFSYDLDVFGKGSLFQKINTACSFVGRNRMKELLIKKPIDKEEINKRQEAVKELAPKRSFRQRLQVEGLISKDCSKDPSELISWLKSEKKTNTKPLVMIGIKISSLITGVVMFIMMVRVFCFFMEGFLDTPVRAPEIFYLIPVYVPLILIVIQVAILGINKDERMKNLVIAEKFKDDINTYKYLLKHIESHKFKGEYLKDITGKFFDEKNNSASKKISEFAKICERVSSRRSSSFVILNIVLMLEYHWTFVLEEWREKSGKDLETWLNVIGEIEALSSLAGLKHDNPQWCFPKIECEKLHIEGEEIGHPLLGEERVGNSFKLGEGKPVVLITGSNMSGKSTFMRTVGVNIILAYSGAPVCAESFTCGILDIYSSMKISDNLTESISSFYAEMIKIKTIVTASNEGKKILFLLDEIFKGTNSADRHIGAKHLIKQLSREGNLGMVSTHDLELAQMEKGEDSKLKNYHFSEHYINNEIKFDYKLKSGVSTTRNAVYLMRLAGIEIDGE